MPVFSGRQVYSITNGLLAQQRWAPNCFLLVDTQTSDRPPVITNNQSMTGDFQCAVLGVWLPGIKAPHFEGEVDFLSCHSNCSYWHAYIYTVHMTWALVPQHFRDMHVRRKSACLALPPIKANSSQNTSHMVMLWEHRCRRNIYAFWHFTVSFFSDNMTKNICKWQILFNDHYRGLSTNLVHCSIYRVTTRGTKNTASTICTATTKATFSLRQVNKAL